MRLPNFEDDYWELRSGEESRLDYPESFRLPPLPDRRKLKRGQAVRLIFDIEGLDQTGYPVLQGERMWVLVTGRWGQGFLGVLLNEPYSLDPADDVYLRLGAEIPFLPEHVIDISQPPDDYVREWLTRRPSKRWPPLPASRNSDPEPNLKAS